jgi:hypothetical protein
MAGSGRPRLCAICGAVSVLFDIVYQGLLHADGVRGGNANLQTPPPTMAARLRPGSTPSFLIIVPPFLIIALLFLIFSSPEMMRNDRK